MDAVEFVKNYIRMCAKVDDCEECPCFETGFCTAPTKTRLPESAEEVVKVVEEWAAAHPVKTRQSVFLEQWPDADMDCGVLHIAPCSLDNHYEGYQGCCDEEQCADCRREFWMQEVG